MDDQFTNLIYGTDIGNNESAGSDIKHPQDVGTADISNAYIRE